jgi:hypothetical protein
LQRFNGADLPGTNSAPEGGLENRTFGIAEQAAEKWLFSSEPVGSMLFPHRVSVGFLCF